MSFGRLVKLRKEEVRVCNDLVRNIFCPVLLIALFDKYVVS